MQVRNVIFLFLLCLSFGCKERQAHFGEREFISLAGTWQCDLGKIQLPGTVDESRLAPRTTDTLITSRLTRLHAYEGKMTYTREIEIPVSSAHKEWRLIMERTKPSVLRIDGDSVGASSLILSPQIYSLGRLSAGKHLISIEVDNSPESVPAGIHGSHAWTDATQTNWNGIIGEFALEAHEGILIENLRFFPDIEAQTARVEMSVYSDEIRKADVSMKGYAWNTKEKAVIPDQNFEIELNKGVDKYVFEISTGENTLLWSEFAPSLYRFHLALSSDGKSDYYTTDVGFRDFSTTGTQFTVNSLKTFLRGKHDACVFPLTGYPPMNKEEWLRQMTIAKQYGFNHYRFHSWTPPCAAFEAANELGIYMQAELPYWGMMDSENNELNDFLMREGEGILATYGNHPSFVMMALGNELGGDTDYMRTLVAEFRKDDSRRLYAFGANNTLGTAGQVEGEDFLVTCRVGGEVGSADYSTHTRATFSFADAKDGGYMNGLYPSSDQTFANAIAASSVPVISHENGQFQIYPNYNEIEKYKGVLYPYNLSIFRQRLEEAGLPDQATDFHKASARFGALCYKADIEMCLRTPGFGGFQLLDLQDYPGQGSAYVGLLDAFMDSKGAMSPEEFRGFCDEIVLLAFLPKYCWNNNETFSTRIMISNFSAGVLANKSLEWEIKDIRTGEIIDRGSLSNVYAPQGELAEAGKLALSLKKVTLVSQLRLELRLGDHTNSYDVWVYPYEEKDTEWSNISETSSLTRALELLGKGETVLFSPNHHDIEALSVGGLFTPDYWNYAMFKSISEHLKRDISPGTLSLLMNPSHPLFREFPTEMHSNWQWWSITRNSRPFILDNTPHEYKPLIQVIDNIERNHKLGILFEMKVGDGKLMVNMCDMKAIADKPEGRQFRKAVFSYLASPEFMPNKEFTPEEVIQLFTAAVEGVNIEGVKNITTYQ